MMGLKPATPKHRTQPRRCQACTRRATAVCASTTTEKRLVTTASHAVVKELPQRRNESAVWITRRSSHPWNSGSSFRSFRLGGSEQAAMYETLNRSRRLKTSEYQSGKSGSAVITFDKLHLIALAIGAGPQRCFANIHQT